MRGYTRAAAGPRRAPARPNGVDRADSVPGVLSRVRYLLSDLFHWLRTHLGLIAVVVLVGAAAVVVGLFAAGEIGGDEEPVPSPAPQVIVRTEEAPEETAELGFPAFATRNTTRVSGIDPVADAAAVALATFPSVGAVEGPAAVSLVDAADWPAGIAAAALVAAPVRAPILLADGGELPDLTAEALAALDPGGSPDTDGNEVFAIGTTAPDGTRALEVEGANPAELAARIAKLRERLAGPPDHILIASSDSPAFAMPAAAWAARSGDPVLFAQRDSVPAPTLGALEDAKDVPVYILGGGDVISAKAQKQIEQAAGGPVARAAEGEDPVANAIEFARYVDGNFGWNINDPGHGFVIASATRPADAGAAAPLSASGTWGPLLVTTDAATPPPELEGYLLDLKPGYEDDPTRAVYNHIWLIGDEDAISVQFQALVDEIAEVAPVKAGSGATLLGPAPGTPEGEGDKRAPGDAKKGGRQ